MLMRRKMLGLNQTHARTHLFKLNFLPLLLPPRPLRPSAPAIIRKSTHIRSGASVRPAVRARAADGIAAHGAAA